MAIYVDLTIKLRALAIPEVMGDMLAPLNARLTELIRVHGISRVAVSFMNPHYAEKVFMLLGPLSAPPTDAEVSIHISEEAPEQPRQLSLMYIHGDSPLTPEGEPSA